MAHTVFSAICWGEETKEMHAEQPRGNKVKVCKKCKQEKSFECFSRYKRSKDGLQYRCKECDKKRYKENKEAYINRQKKYYEENKEKIKEKIKEWRIKNKEKIK